MGLIQPGYCAAGGVVEGSLPGLAGSSPGHHGRGLHIPCRRFVQVDAVVLQGRGQDLVEAGAILGIGGLGRDQVVFRRWPGCAAAAARSPWWKRPAAASSLRRRGSAGHSPGRPWRPAPARGRWSARTAHSPPACGSACRAAPAAAPPGGTPSATAPAPTARSLLPRGMVRLKPKPLSGDELLKAWSSAVP